jgi:DNA-directed RNA polymerase subunit RPC12/RpoP
MPSDLDSESIIIVCPHCSNQHEETILRLKYEPRLSCPDCGQYILINLLDLYTMLESAQKSCKALLKKLTHVSNGKSPH